MPEKLSRISSGRRCAGRSSSRRCGWRSRFLLPWLAPFLMALGAAALNGTGGRGSGAARLAQGVWAAGLVTLAVLAAAAGAVYALASKGVDMLTDFARQVPELVASAEQTLGAAGGADAGSTSPPRRRA